jgi:transcriptional regulator with XRE-family HTH domain
MARRKPPTVVEQILGAIDESGLSGRDVAERAGLSASIVSRLRTGRRTVLVATAESLCRAVGRRLAVVPEPASAPPPPARKRS